MNSGDTWWRAALAGYCLLVIGFLVVPLAIILPLSFSSADFLQFPPPGLSLKWYDAFFGSRAWLAAASISIRVAAVTTVLALLVGTPAAFFLARVRERRLAWLIDKLMVAPIIIPGMVTAISVYSFLAGFRMVGSFQALVIGHLILALPFVVIVMTAALRQFDRSLEDAAVGLGASRLRAVLLVTLPLTRPSLLTAAFFAFMASFDDLVIAMFLSGSNATLPKKTFENIGYALDPTVAVVSSLQITLLAVAFAAWYVLVGRKSSSSF